MATTTTTTSTSTTTTTTTLASPPLPSVFNALTGTLQDTLAQAFCAQLQEMAEFDAAFVQFYNWMFNSDGSPTAAFEAMICNIFQNCNSILAGGTTTAPVLQTWTAVATSQEWTACCLNAAGTMGAACVSGGGIYVSTDGQLQVWNLISGTASAAWVDICCDSAFDNIYAVNGTQVVQSTNQGATFSQVASGHAFTSLACSSNGQTVYAGYNGGYVYSTNGASSFSTTALSGVDILSFGMSGDAATIIYWPASAGPVVLPGGLVGGILGVTSGNPTGPCTIACPSNGVQGTFYFAAQGVPIWQFLNNGLNSVNYATSPNYSWSSVACSSDGISVIVAVAPANQIQLSQNDGTSFTAVGTIQNYVDVAVSASGQVGLAAVNGGQLYVGN